MRWPTLTTRLRCHPEGTQEDARRTSTTKLGSTVGQTHAFFRARFPIHQKPNPNAVTTPANFQYGGSNPISRNTKIYPAATTAVGPNTIQNARFTALRSHQASINRGSETCHPEGIREDARRTSTSGVCNQSSRLPKLTADRPRSPCPFPKPPPRPTALPAAFPSISPSSARKNTSPYFPPKDSRS